MGEDRGIPDHVNDGVPEDEIDRMERYRAALDALAIYGGDGDAMRMIGDFSSLTNMRREAFINAAINNVPAIIKKMRASYPAICDLQGLVDRVRLEVIIRRLD
jgi:hypothetical protein